MSKLSCTNEGRLVQKTGINDDTLEQNEQDDGAKKERRIRMRSMRQDWYKNRAFFFWWLRRTRWTLLRKELPTFFGVGVTFVGSTP